MFSGCFSKAKTEKCDQQNRSFSSKSEMFMPCAATYFLEVGARVSLKITTKGYFKGKKSLKI